MATLLAIKRLVACLVTKPALLWICWTIAGRVTLNTACIASAGEGTFDTLVRTVSLVVTNLSAVEAFASEATSRGFVRAVSSKVAGLVAAMDRVSMIE
jgi:hypothetical protein